MNGACAYNISSKSLPLVGKWEYALFIVGDFGLAFAFEWKVKWRISNI